MTLKLSALIWLSVGFLLVSGAVTRAVSEDLSVQLQLPNDLVFTGRDALDWNSTPHLTIVDAKTLKTSAFYQANSAVNLRAMSWSPQGDLLAVLHIYAQPEGEYGYPTALCIVTVSGDLQTCLHEKTPRFFAEAPFLIDFEYEVTWSADGQKVYYIAEDAIQETRYLIEADVVTGATLRTIYEVSATNEDQIPTVIIWTPDLKYVAAGVGLTERSGILVNLETGEQLDLSKVVAAWPYSTGPTRPEGSGYVCNSFSPQSNYLTAINEYDNRLVIFDKELNILYTVQDFGIEGRVKIYCPSWSVDESTSYFFVLNLDHEPNYIFTYSLQDDRLVSRVAAAVYPPLVFSPEQTHIAFEIPHPSASKIHVLYPDGTIQLFGDPFQYAQYPVWRPISDQ